MNVEMENENESANSGSKEILRKKCCLIIGMPALWFLGDAVPCLILGVLIVVFWRKAKQAP